VIVPETDSKRHGKNDRQQKKRIKSELFIELQQGLKKWGQL
jgi:hypothetical protein